MSVTSAVRRTADWFVRSQDDEVRRAVTTVIQMIDPSGSITTKPGKWAVDLEDRVLYYNRQFGGRPLNEVEYMYLTFHEGGHLLHTQKCPIPDWVTKPKAFHKLWNACEDMRMERAMMASFPGFLSIRDTVGGRLLNEAVGSRMPDVLRTQDFATATWLSAMTNEYQQRWSNIARRNPIPDPLHFDYHLGGSACADTHPLYRKAVESPTMQSMMQYVEAIYRYLYPDQDTEGEDEDSDEGEQEGEPEPEQGEGESTEGESDDTESEPEPDEGEGEGEGESDDAEGDEDGDESEGTEGEQDGTEGDDDDESDTSDGGGEGEQEDEDTEGDDAEGSGDAEGDESDATEGDESDGEDGEGEQPDESDTEGEGSGTEQDGDEPEPTDEPEAGESDDDDDTEGDKDDEPEEMEPVNIFDDDEEFDQPPPEDQEPAAPAGAWREYVLDGAANRFSVVMRSMLRKNDDRGKRRNVAFGKIDLQRYYRMDHPIYDFNVFTRRVDPDQPRYALIISVDTSGSMISYMSGGRMAWQSALEAAATLAEAWNQLRLPWTVFGWGSRVNYVVNDGSPGWQLDIVTNRGTTGGGTEEHVAIATALDLAMHYASLGFQPLWFHISDGDAQTTDQAGIDKFVDTFGAAHLYFIGMNVGSRQGGQFPNFVSVWDADELYTYMKTTIRRQVYNAVR